MSSPTTRDILRAVSTNNPDRRRDHITTVYGIVLVILMSSALLLHGVDVTLRSSVKSPALSLGMLLTGLGCTLLVPRALGPASMSPPIARWLGSSPLPRVELLRGSLGTTALLTSAVGALFGLITALTAGFDLGRCALESVGGILVGLAATVVCLQAQARGRTGQANIRRGALVLVVGGAIASALASVEPTVFPQVVAWVPEVAVAAVALGTLAAGLVRWRTWLDAVPGASARDAGSITHAWLDAAASLDVGGVTARTELVRARRTGAFATRRTRSSGPYLGLVERHLTTLGRRASRVASWIALCALAWLVARLFGHAAAAVTLAISTAGLALVLTPMPRAWLESSSLWRMFPQDPRRAVWSLSVVPTLLVLMISGLVGVASGLGVGGIALGFAAMTLTLRRHRRPPIELGQTMDTPFGTIPLGIVTAVTFGTETLVATLVVGLSFSWLVALAVGAGWFVLTLAGARPIGVRA